MQIYKRLGHPTMLHFDNKGKYGSTFKEIQIVYINGTFRAYITDGYKYLNHGHTFKNLKNAVQFGIVTLERKSA